jgi:putative salt-induced outer membrane protein
VVYTAGGEFIWQVSETTKFEQLASANMASDNTYWETITRLKVDIVESLALSVGYTVQGNTDVDDGVDKTDRYTAITLDYSF